MARVQRRRHSKTSTSLSSSWLTGLVLCIVLGFAAFEFYQAHKPHPLPPESAKVCFTPSQTCQKLILSEIAQAKHTILVQAYSFTDPQIVHLLVKKHKEGIQVKVILDKSNRSDPHGQLALLKKSYIPVRIDAPAGIAHNKVIIIDHEIVVTGSYNFSAAAYKRNAENVLVLHDRNLAQQYRHNWDHRWAQSKES
jgi:phosphatidylserine/phosphatidylglycerophosphate/cardiolipin synthase-like enzyme